MEAIIADHIYAHGEQPSAASSQDGALALEMHDVLFERESVHGGQFRILEGMTFSVQRGEFLSIVGRSGCGKTSTLLLSGGFAFPTAGIVRWRGSSQNASSPALVCQSDAVFGWRTVEGNLRLVMQRQEEKRVQFGNLENLLRLTGLERFRSFFPRELSGGLRKRVELARAWLSGLDLLLDEPLGQLDNVTRQEMQFLLQELWLKNPRTIIMATHGLEEALFLSSRVLVMEGPPGRIKAEVIVPFPRPRDPELIFDTEFQRLRQELHRLL